MSVLACPICGRDAESAVLGEASWLAPEALARLAATNPGWRRVDGACPACVQAALLQLLLEHGEDALHRGVQAVWPIDAEAAFGALPTPLRLHADPRFAGRRVTIALVDAGFYPHPDLVEPHNRVRAVVDAGMEPAQVLRFAPGERPRWPGWDAGAAQQWHGLMTSAVAAGNGRLSHGLYSGLAPEAELVLVQAREPNGRISNASITRALRWLIAHGPALGVRVVSLSVSGDPVEPLAGNPVDAAVEALLHMGVLVVAAAGNAGERRLIPPATAPGALTVGGLDDMNTLDHAARALWHSNYGAPLDGWFKPELVAPSIWVAAPLLPGTPEAATAAVLLAGRARGDRSVESELAARRLISPHYQHVDGTSFAAPIVASLAACMLEAAPTLTPRRLRELLIAAAEPVTGAPAERQGAGAIHAGRAVALALADRHGAAADFAASPLAGEDEVNFWLHDDGAREVRVFGSWDGWAQPGRMAVTVEPGVWRAALPHPAPGAYVYKWLVDGRWLPDPSNPRRKHDGYGGWNSLLEV